MTQASARAAGALYGLAIGDALGMPTQALPRDQIVARYGSVIATFEEAPAGHPLAAGLGPAPSPTTPSRPCCSRASSSPPAAAPIQAR